jgi:hypothetical protein
MQPWIYSSFARWKLGLSTTCSVTIHKSHQCPLSQLKKYDTLVRFNQNIVFVSLATTSTLTGLMSLQNHLVYCHFTLLHLLLRLVLRFCWHSTPFTSIPLIAQYWDGDVWAHNKGCSVHRVTAHKCSSFSTSITSGTNEGKSNVLALWRFVWILTLSYMGGDHDEDHGKHCFTVLDSVQVPIFYS